MNRITYDIAVGLNPMTSPELHTRPTRGTNSLTNGRVRIAAGTMPTKLMSALRLPYFSATLSLTYWPVIDPVKNNPNNSGARC